MTQIAMLKPKTTKPNQLTIDIVVNLPSSIHRLSRLTYGTRALYDVPQTYKSPESHIDIHTSYHRDGEMHQVLTRGKLMESPSERLIGKAEPHTKDRKCTLSQGKGQPWSSLKGVQRIASPFNVRPKFGNIEKMSSGYPVYRGSDADYLFEIDAKSLPSACIAIQYFLVETSNIKALEEATGKIVNSWKDGETNVTWRPQEFITIERVELFTNFSPWLAIVLISK